MGDVVSMDDYRSRSKPEPKARDGLAQKLAELSRAEQAAADEADRWSRLAETFAKLKNPI